MYGWINKECKAHALGYRHCILFRGATSPNHFLLVLCVCCHLLLVLLLYVMFPPLWGLCCKDGATRNASRNTKLLLLVIIMLFYSNEQPHLTPSFGHTCVCHCFFGFVIVFLLITIDMSLLSFII